MQAWTASELARFLHWAETRDPDLAMGWRLDLRHTRATLLLAAGGR